MSSTQCLAAWLLAGVILVYNVHVRTKVLGHVDLKSETSIDFTLSKHAFEIHSTNGDNETQHTRKSDITPYLVRKFVEVEWLIIFLHCLRAKEMNLQVMKEVPSAAASPDLEIRRNKNKRPSDDTERDVKSANIRKSKVILNKKRLDRFSSFESLSSSADSSFSEGRNSEAHQPNLVKLEDLEADLELACESTKNLIEEHRTGKVR